MSSVVFLFLNRVPRPKFEGSLTDLKLSNHGEAREFTTTKGVFCFLCVTTGWCVLFVEICNLKFRNVLIIVQVKPLGLSCEQRKFFFCCAHYPRFLKTDAMCLQDFVESLFFFFFFFFTEVVYCTFRWFVLQQKPKQLKDSQWITGRQWELICERRKLP